MARASFFLACWLIAGFLPAQEGELRFKRLSVEHGLSHSSVRSILQDHEGYVWVGTQDGLNRYDGYGFRVFKNDPDDPGSLAASDVNVVYEDRRKTLWIGTLGGLHRYQRREESFVRSRHDPADEGTLSDNAVRSLLEDASGAFWVGTDEGLHLFDRDTGVAARYQHQPAEPTSLSGRLVWALCQDSAGNLWVGSDKGLNRLDARERGGRTFEHFRHDASDPESLSHDWVLAIREDRGGKLWIGTRDGLNHFDPVSGRSVRYLHDPRDPSSLSENFVRSLHLDGAGQLWVGTYLGGLNVFDGATFRTFRQDSADLSSLSNNLVSSIHEDRTGILWFGTYLGINQHNPAHRQFVTYQQRPEREQTLSGRSVWAILEDRSGILWAGTYENGLNRIDRETGKIDHFQPDPSDPGSLPSGAVSALVEDRAGELWVGTWGGLSKLDPARRRFIHYQHDAEDPESLSSNVVQALLEDAAGRLWVGTFVGLNLFDRDTGRSRRTTAAAGQPRPLGESPIFVLYEDRAGTVWVGSGAGLSRLDAGGEIFEHLSHEPSNRDGLSGEKVVSLLEDRSGRLWVGTLGAGLNRLDPGAGERFVHYRERDGLPSDSILGILEDDAGNIWLATYRGLGRLDPQSGAVDSFSADSGLQGDIFSLGSAFWSARGEMFFGGTQGLNAFFPDRITGDVHPPPVVVTDFRLFNQRVPLASLAMDGVAENGVGEPAIVLSHQDYLFSLEFAALHFASTDKNRYAYRLEGFDRDWILADSTQRVAQYSNLDGGDYLFRVKAANPDGVWNEAGATIRIRIKPPFWATWWFRSAMVAAIVGLLLTAHRASVSRQRRIQKAITEGEKAAEREALIRELEAKNDELERFAYTVSHDLKAPLVTIRGFLGLLKRDTAAGDQKRVAHDFERIDRATEKMQLLLSEILELSRIGLTAESSAEIPFGDLVSEALEVLSGPIHDLGVEVTVMPDLPEVVGERTRLLEVLQNLLQNAIKYLGDQPRPRVEIGVRRDGGGDSDSGEMAFYVRDNGIGIEPRYHDKVFGLFERLDPETEGTGVGLALVKRIVEVHGGRVWIESEGSGSGTTIWFTLRSTGRGVAAT